MIDIVAHTRTVAVYLILQDFDSRRLNFKNSYTKCTHIPVPFQGGTQSKKACICTWNICISKARCSHNPTRLIWPHRTCASCANLQRKTSERASLHPRPQRKESNRYIKITQKAIQAGIYPEAWRLNHGISRYGCSKGSDFLWQWAKIWHM